jgi:hypothetical protein
MARAELRFPPERFRPSRQTDIPFKRSLLLKAVSIGFVAAVALAPASFGQRGGAGGGGGGGSHGSAATAGASGASAHYGGGGGEWHSGSGGGGRASGRSSGGSGHRDTGHSGGAKWGRGSSSPKGGEGQLGSSGSRGMEGSGNVRTTGFRAAVRRFFGIRTSAERPAISSAGSLSSLDATASRALERAALPPAFDHVYLREFPEFRAEASFRRGSDAGQSQAELRRRMPPFPRRGRPIYGGWYWGYWPEFGFGFPFFFDFDDFDYCGWFACRQYTINATPTMLIYLRGGSAVEVTDYWVEGVTLHYVTESGKKGSVPVADVDVGRTTDANGRLGFKFRLDRTEPGLPLDRIESQAEPDQTNEGNRGGGPSS